MGTETLRDACRSDMPPLGDIWIETDQTAAMFERLDCLMERGRQGSSFSSLLVIGVPGCGKTYGLKEWARQRLGASSDFRMTLSEVPPGCALKGMASQLLTDLGDPKPDGGTQNAMTTRVKKIAATRDLIVIDEIQRLIGDKGKVKAHVPAWIANLLNHRVCPLVLVGEEHSTKIFTDSAYLERRTMGQITMRPYRWSDANDRERFRVFLYLADQRLGLPRLSDLQDLETAHRIHIFSGGRIGRAMALLDEARYLARRAGLGSMTPEILATAVDRMRIGDSAGSPNPFRLVDPRQAVRTQRRGAASDESKD